MTLFAVAVRRIAPAHVVLLVLALFSCTAMAQDSPPQPEPEPATATSADRKASRNSGADEIVVTARKREERLQDVPISITAFTAEKLRERNIQNAYDLAAFTPNFQLTESLGRRLDSPNVRGQFGPLIGATAPNASFFVDGVYVSGSIGTASVANLDRIEVIRGPQSATFGRATFSGAINYITREATDEYEGQVNSRYGEDGEFELGAWASGPIVEDTLYFYAGASYEKWDGQWRNGLQPYDTVAGYQAGGYPAIGINEPYGLNFFGGFAWDSNPQLPGDPPCLSGDGTNDAGCAPTVGDNSELGGQETKIATVKLTWQATDNLRFNVKYERSEGDDDHFVSLFIPPGGSNYCFNRAGGGIAPGAGDALDPRAGTRSPGWLCGPVEDSGFVSKLNLPNFWRGVTLSNPGSGGPQTSAPAPFIGQQETIDRYLTEFVWDMNDYELIGRYARNDVTSEFVRDLDRSYALGPLATGLFEAYSRNEDLDDSIEVRLSSPGDKRLRWQAGYYWYNFEQEQFQRNFNGFALSFLEGSRGSAEVINTAYFGSIEFDLTSTLTFAFEGRYAKDELSRTTALFDDDDDPLTPQVRLKDSDNFYSFSPRATLTWDVLADESLTGYVQIAEGNKPGGFNPAYFDGDADFTRIDRDDVLIDEEEATTYEIGLKGSLLDNKLNASLSVFYIDWTNQAINVLKCIPDLNVGIDCQENNVIENAGKSSVKGLELEMQWYPTLYQSYTLAYGYTDSRLDEYLDDEYAVLRCPEGCFETVPGSDELTFAARRLRDRKANVAGNRAPRVPKHNLALSQLYQAPLAAELEWFVRNDLLYESKRYSTTANLNFAPSQWTWNGRVGVEAEQWSVAFYIDNITNEKSPVLVQNFPLFDQSQNYFSPGGEVNQQAFQISPRRSRNAGIVASYRFGGR